MTAPTTESSRTQADRARAFSDLHRDGVLVLPNAWDVASAVLVRDAGARAVATTSAGASWSTGTPDGGHLGRDRAVDLVARITALVDEPVTADIEGGYGADAAAVAVTAQAVLDAGAVGVNLEDGGGAPLRDRREQAERIAAVRATADAAGVALFVNARTDTYLLGVDEPFAETVRRAEAYLAAGADGIFVPGVADPATIRRLVAAVDAPLNVMAGPGAPGVGQLEDLGVRRVSVGMAIAQAAYGLTHRAAVELLTDGTYDALAGGLGYAEMNVALRTGASVS
jgi:2-methylisocitrate lyase-like PEP mutase family enzyme